MTPGIHDLSEELDLVRRSLGKNGQRLSLQLATLNDESDIENPEAISKIPELTEKLSISNKQELVDNVEALYSILARPQVFSESPSYTALLIDRTINDIRQNTLDIIAIARALRLPTQPNLPNPPDALLLQKESSSQVLTGLSQRISSIEDHISRVKLFGEDEITGIKISGNQIGFINFYIEKIELKLSLADAMISIRRVFDVLAISKIFSAIVSIAREVYKLFVGKSGVDKKIAENFAEIREEAASGLELAQSAIRDNLERKNSEAHRIWKREEIKALVAASVPIPDDAIPFVDEISVNPDNYSLLKDIPKLISLKSLYIEMRKGMLSLDSMSLPDIETLEIERAGDDSIEFIYSLKDLRSLSLSTSVLSYKRALNLRENFDFKNLNYLRIENALLRTLPNFSDCGAIDSVVLLNCSVKNWSRLSTLKCRKLSIFWNDSTRSEKEQIKKISQISAMPNVEVFEIFASKRIQFDKWVPFPNLKILRTNQWINPADTEKWTGITVE